MKYFKLRNLLAIGLTLVLALSALGIIALAGDQNPTVMYNGSTKKVEFENALLPFFPASEAPDLFTDLKGMMPGDSATQTIHVGVKNTNMDTIKLYLRTENENADYQKLMSYADWVTFTVKQGDTILEEGNLRDGVLLGTFSSNKKIDLEVTLNVNIEAGNELQGLTAAVDWIFTAEVIPYIPPAPAPGKIPAAKIPWLNGVDHFNYIVGYPDGTVRPNGEITRAEVATIFFRLLTEEAREMFWGSSSSYPDVNVKDWFNVAVSTLTNAGVIEGYEDGTFRPNASITRAELATIISRFDQTFGTFETDAEFPDITAHWAEEYIKHSATRNWVVGYPDGTFRPNQNITRAETVTMVNRILQRAVSEHGLLNGHIDWIDNYANSWYYLDMLEAGNYHSYRMTTETVADQQYKYGAWTELFELIDWAAQEQAWIAANK